MIKRCAKVGVFCLAFWAASRFCDHYTQGFTVASIDAKIPNIEHFVTDASIDSNLKTVLSRPFHYMNRGGQSYVFVSDDGTTVLKFFKKNHALPDTWVDAIDRHLPSFLKRFRQQFLPTRYERFHTIFSSCHLAYTQLKEETGLLYLHLTPTEEKLPKVTLVDSMKNHHEIDLNTTSFVVQKKGVLFFAVLKQQLAQKDDEGIKESIRTMMTYIFDRSFKGIRDTDNALKRNYGYIGGKASSLDTGSFILDSRLKEPKMCQKEVFRKTRRLRKWLKNHCSHLLPFYEEFFEELTKRDPSSSPASQDAFL